VPPSIDSLDLPPFKPRFPWWGPDLQTIAVLLTGMGMDGARGMLNLRQKGAVTYAQDERSCVVFGMPRAAIELNAVDEIQDLVKIAPSVLGRLAAVSA